MPKRASRRKRTPRAYDWMTYVESAADEMRVAVELLARLRWADALARRNLKIAPSYGPGHGGRYRSRSFSYVLKGILDRLLPPEDIVERLSHREIKKLLDVWESEIREWGQAIWKQRGEVLRLRGERARLAEQVESWKDLGITKQAEARRLVADLDANPTQKVRTSSGWEAVHIFEPVDEFDNPLPDELSEDEIADLSRAPKDDRAIRRLLTGGIKKARGGVRDIDPRLLRDKK